VRHRGTLNWGNPTMGVPIKDLDQNGERKNFRGMEKRLMRPSLRTF